MSEVFSLYYRYEPRKADAFFAVSFRLTNSEDKMEIDLIFKIAAIGIIVSILNQILSRAEKSEYATLTTLMGIIIVLLMLIPEISNLFENVKELIEF